MTQPNNTALYKVKKIFEKLNGFDSVLNIYLSFNMNRKAF